MKTGGGLGHPAGVGVTTNGGQIPDPCDAPDGAKTTLVIGTRQQESVGEASGCLVQLHGEGLGTRIELRPGATRFGREQDNDVVLEHESVSRRHCEIALGADLVSVTDLGSTNGTFIADQRLTSGCPIELRSGNLLRIGAVIFKFLQGGDVESAYHDEIYKSSVIDPLTRVYNRRYLFDHLTREIARAHRHSRPLALILFDVDRFKSINDEFGHLAGDQVLRELAELISGNVRCEDCCARYGGEEFAVVSTENDIEASCVLAEKLRGLVEVHDFRFEGNSIPVTISLGVATMSQDMHEPADLLGAADARLYQAKRLGRNRVAR